jgi:uncharacterized protein YuzE
MRETLEAVNVRASYDELADVLYVSIGDPESCTTEDDEKGLLWRYSKRTGKPSGVTILGFHEGDWPSDIERLVAEISERLNVPRSEISPVLAALP